MDCGQVEFIIIQRWDNRAIANSGDPKVENFRKSHRQQEVQEIGEGGQDAIRFLYYVFACVS